MNKQQTVQKRHSKKHIEKIDSMKCYSLGNDFCGLDVKDPQNVASRELSNLPFAKLVVYKDINNKIVGGGIRVHSNLWYEIEFQKEGSA